MKSFKFINTERFSPVIYEKDLPWEEDYFHKKPENITKKFLESGDYYIDEDWWNIQYDRCMNGYLVEDIIEPGGEVFVTDLKSYTDPKTKETFTWGKNIEVFENGKRIYLKELDVWIQDRNIYIPGRLYFYLNFWKINRLDETIGRKRLLHPIFTDLAFENWMIRDIYINKKRQNNLWAKSRQKGFSEEEAADTAYNILFWDHSQSIILGGEDFYNDNTMKMVKRGLKEMTNTQFYKELSTNSMEKVFTENTGAELYSRTCKNNSQAASGLTPTKAHHEEIGIWKKGLVKDTSKTIDASLQAQGITTGFKVFTGTGGDMADGVDDMKQMFYNPRASKLLEFDNVYEQNDGSKIARFIPGHRFELIDENGNSLVTESIKKILKDIEDSAEDDKHIEMIMKPLKPSWIFRLKEGGYFGRDVTYRCNKRIAYINNHREEQVVKRYDGRWINRKNLWEGVELYAEPNGPFLISEPPEKDSLGNVYELLYRAGTDSYDQDESNYSTSKGACWIKKGFLNANKTYNKYVAGIIMRPDTAHGGATKFYEKTAMLCMAYRAINLIEYSKIRIIDWYLENGLHGLLKLRPEFVTARMVQKSATNNMYGIDAATKPHWLAYQKQLLDEENFIEKCEFIELLEAWGNFIYDPSGKKYNCDNTIASSLCTVAEEDEKELEAYSKEKTEKVNRLRYIMRNGKMIQTI